MAAGDLFPGQPAWPWPFLVVTELPGRRYATLAARLDPAQRAAIARSLGQLLRRLHDLPLPPASTPGPLASSWDRFVDLLHRRRREVAADHRRWALLPARLCDQLDGWLPGPERLVDPSRPPVFVHGDLHAEHVFVDPASATLHGVIDFTDVYAGDPRYDLVALHFNAFRLDATLLSACLDAYGWATVGTTGRRRCSPSPCYTTSTCSAPTCGWSGSPPWMNSPTRSGVAPEEASHQASPRSLTACCTKPALDRRRVVVAIRQPRQGGSSEPEMTVQARPGVGRPEIALEQSFNPKKQQSVPQGVHGCL